MMPEGPEVRSLVDRMHHRYSGGGWEIRGASIVSGRYKDSGTPPQGWEALTSNLPLRVDSVRAKGKFIWFELSSQAGGDGGGGGGGMDRGASKVQLTAWSTLGLTGGWTLRPHRHARLAFHLAPIQGQQERSAHSESSLVLSAPPPAWEGEKLLFYDMRNFGTFKVCTDPAFLDQKLAKLGPSWLPDPFLSVPEQDMKKKEGSKEGAEEDDEDNEDESKEGGGKRRHKSSSPLTWATFHDLVSKSSKRYPQRPLAVFLMDQTKTSGIGNYILSEVLFETRTWPWAAMGSVGAKRWRAIYDSASRVTVQSHAAQAAGGSKYAAATAKGWRSTAAIATTTSATASAAAAAAAAVEDPNPRSSNTAGAAPSRSSSSVDRRKCGGSGSVEFKLMVYGRATTPLALVTQAAVVAAAEEAAGQAVAESPGQQQQLEVGCFPIVRSEGAHKRTVHWVPSLQEGGKDGPDQGAPLDMVSAPSDRTPASDQSLAATRAPCPVTPPSSLTVAELKKECAARGLRVSGRKADLIARLIAEVNDPAASGGTGGTADGDLAVKTEGQRN
jgi:formamidopyrimidine-DNA glycosylase